MNLYYYCIFENDCVDIILSSPTKYEEDEFREICFEAKRTKLKYETYIYTNSNVAEHLISKYDFTEVNIKDYFSCNSFYDKDGKEKCY